MGFLLYMIFRTKPYALGMYFGGLILDCIFIVLFNEVYK